MSGQSKLSYKESDARSAWQALYAGDRRLFAIDLNEHSAKVYVLGSMHHMYEACVKDRPLDGYMYESLGGHDKPMIAFMDADMYVACNPCRTAEAMCETQVYYIERVVRELLERPEGSGASKQPGATSVSGTTATRILVETCYREEKVSFHFKLPDVLLRNMQDQRAFWAHMVALMKAHRTARNNASVRRCYMCMQG